MRPRDPLCPEYQLPSYTPPAPVPEVRELHYVHMHLACLPLCYKGNPNQDAVFLNTVLAVFGGRD